MAESHHTAGAKSVSNYMTPEQMRSLGYRVIDELVDQVLDLLQREVWSHIMHVDHPRFFAFVPGPGNFVSAMADALVAGFNPFAGTWLEASGPTQIELITVDWLRQLGGLPATAGGHFVSGGSAAKLSPPGAGWSRLA